MVSHYHNQELTINLPEATLRVLQHRAQGQNSSLSQYGLSLIVKGLMAEEYTNLDAALGGKRIPAAETESELVTVP